jgi:phenylacetate-CoA ligase
LHDVQREEIEQAFACRLFDFYASAERVIFAAECEAHSGKHLIEEYGYVEVVDSEGRPVEEGQPGFLTGTTLHNTAMPLLRYKMSDVTYLRPEPCPCGRAGRMMADVSTKVEDIITTAGGRLVSPSTLTHPFKTVRGVEKSQIIQERPDHLTVLIVAKSTFDASEEARLVALLHDRVGKAMQIDIRRETDIPRERSGKYRWVISHVPIPRLGGRDGGVA